MSDKTFLQELQSIHAKIERVQAIGHDGDIRPSELDEIKGDVKAMIEQCLEIQLAMMKQGTIPDAKGR